MMKYRMDIPKLVSHICLECSSFMSTQSIHTNDLRRIKLSSFKDVIDTLKIKAIFTNLIVMWSIKF